MPFDQPNVPLQELQRGDTVLVPPATVAMIAEVFRHGDTGVTLILTTGHAYSGSLDQEVVLINRGGAEAVSVLAS